MDTITDIDTTLRIEALRLAHHVAHENDIDPIELADRYHSFLTGNYTVSRVNQRADDGPTFVPSPSAVKQQDLLRSIDDKLGVLVEANKQNRHVYMAEAGDPDAAAAALRELRRKRSTKRSARVAQPKADA